MAPPIVTTVAQLVPLLPQQGLIGIDGWHGAGKTTLAKEIASLISRPILDLDDFIKRGRDCYFRALRMDEIEERLRQASDAIVCGCTLLKVLATLRLDAFVIYVRRMDTVGLWGDDPALTAKLDDEFSPSELELEVRAYHAEFQPHDRCGVVYERVG